MTSRRHDHASPRDAAVRRRRCEPTARRFRLWAPGAASRSQLELDGAARRCRCTAIGDGWFEVEAPVRRRRCATAIGSTTVCAVPDPASRAQPDDVHGPSLVVDPRAYRWRDADWRGRPWDEAVLYELHVGTFSSAALRRRAARAARPSGRARRHRDRADAGRRFSRAGATGATTACCRSRRTRAYGTPDELKALVDAAHARGLMVFLDVVYNHFGPDGNYLPLYAPQFFTRRHHDAVGRGDQLHAEPRRCATSSSTTRSTGSRSTASTACASTPCTRSSTTRSWLDEMARRRCARPIEPGRHVHLVLENDGNDAPQRTCGRRLRRAVERRRPSRRCMCC